MAPELNHIDPELFCIAARLHRKRNLPPNSRTFLARFYSKSHACLHSCS